jgi:hypothetical protein
MLERSSLSRLKSIQLLTLLFCGVKTTMAARRFLAALVCRLLAKHPPPMLLAHFVGDACSRESYQLGERRVRPA